MPPANATEQLAQSLNCSPQEFGCTTHYLTNLFDPTRPQHAELVNLICMKCNEYLRGDDNTKGRKPEIIANFLSSLGNIPTQQRKEAEKRLKGFMQRLQIDAPLIRRFMQSYAAGVQIAYAEAPWDKDITIKLDNNKASGVEVDSKASDTAICIGYNHIVLYAILNGLKASKTLHDVLLTPDEYIMGTGMEEGRHASQFFSRHFQAGNPELQHQVQEEAQKILTGQMMVDGRSMSTEEKIAHDKIDPMEIDARQFVLTHIDRIKSVAGTLGQQRKL